MIFKDNDAENKRGTDSILWKDLLNIKLFEVVRKRKQGSF